MVFFGWCLLAGICSVSLAAETAQLTSGSYNHSLDNNDNFSFDDQWLVYDTRTDAGGIQAGRRIEKVHVRTGEIVVLYEAPGADASGPGTGAVSYHPSKPQIAFIHGLLSHSADRPYAQWRRFGMLLDETDPQSARSADARDVRPPFTPGALRGGTHRHEFSGDGKWLGFTYNDALMVTRGERFNLRTIGVTQLDRPVRIRGRQDGSNFDGSGTSAVVVRVTPDPRPGSDEISRAAWDSWIGTDGYVRSGRRQKRARAFLGTVRSRSGEDVPEVFVVDIPSDITVPGPWGPLEGTVDTMPAPPAGTRQRRLTHTTSDRYPGFQGNVRSAPDGSLLSSLRRDDEGIVQVVLISPDTGRQRMLTDFDSDVQSECRWHPQGRHVCFVQNNALIVACVETGAWQRVTTPSAEPPYAPVWSRDGSAVAFNRRVVDEQSQNRYEQIFIVRPDTLP